MQTHTFIIIVCHLDTHTHIDVILTFDPKSNSEVATF